MYGNSVDRATFGPSQFAGEPSLGWFQLAIRDLRRTAPCWRFSGLSEDDHSKGIHFRGAGGAAWGSYAFGWMLRVSV